MDIDFMSVVCVYIKNRLRQKSIFNFNWHSI